MILPIGNILVVGPLAEISVEISASRALEHSIFICGADFFSGFDKINNFWQQKQQMLFLSNVTPKALPSGKVLLGGPSGGNNTLFPEKTPVFVAPGQKGVPIELRRAEISVKKIFSSIVNNK